MNFTVCEFYINKAIQKSFLEKVTIPSARGSTKKPGLEKGKAESMTNHLRGDGFGI